MVRVGIRAPSAALFCFWLFACADGSRVGDDSDTRIRQSPRETGSDPDKSAKNATDDAPITLRVLLAATVAGNAGTASSSGGSTSAGGAGGTSSVGGNGGVAGVAGTSCRSVYCGDGCRDTTKEECDEGNGSPGKFCNWACQLQDNWATHSEGTLPLGSRVTRHLGRGRHPLAANADRFAVAVVEQITPSEQQVRVAVHNDQGVSIADAAMSTGTWVADRADPVVAVLGNGDVVTAYTEFGGDGDGLGIALRRLRAGQTTADTVSWASSPSFAAQYDADILALSDRILVAYTDEYDATSGPDITLREFGLDLKPTKTTALGATGDVEGRVALANLGSSWGAAWRRAAADGTETIEVYDAANAASWSIGPLGAADGDDAPALVALDATRRMVLYTRAADPANNLRYGKLYLAVLSTASPGAPISNSAVALTSTAYQNYTSVAARRPALLQVGNEAYMAWSSGQRSADPSFVNAEEVWFERVTPNLSGGTPTFTMNGEVALPRWSNERVGDQRAPAMALLGPSANQPGTALVAAWDDYGETLGTGSGEPEVLTQVTPLALKRDATTPATDCTTTALCAAKTGRCTAANQCQSGLACSTAIGPNFGYAPGTGVCVATHCTNTSIDSGETGMNCGGTDCGNCLCGDGILSTELGEVCDTAGNSATCDSDCSAPVCGDGLVNTAAGEQCDLGAANGSNGQCLSNCTLPPSCTTGGTCLGVWSQRGSSSSNQIGVVIRIVNNSSDTTAKSLNGITLRYWFTGDGISNYTLACDSGGTVLSCSNITGITTNFSPIRIGADRLMTITLNTTATLAQRADTGNIQLRFVKTDSTPTIQTNDYSYPQAAITANPNIGMYRSGVRIWGVEPSASYACRSATTDPGEVCDNASNTNCNDTCSGFLPVNGKACTNSSHCLYVEQYSNDSSTDNTIRPYFRIVNRSGVPIALNRIKLKYWFTAESATAALAVACTTGPFGDCSKMSRTVAHITPTYTTADSLVTLTFTSTNVLGITDTTNTMQFNANRTDYVNMTEANDWSQTKSTAAVAAPKFALYVDNQLWWGEEAK